MTEKHSPRGLWIIVALALLWGVGSLSPARAADPGASEDWTGVPAPPHNGTDGTTGPTGGEGDPDWWQTDVWTGTEMGALPAPTSPNEALPGRTFQLVESSFSGLVNWLLQMSGRHLGF